MDALLTNPAIQSGVVPFFIALLLGAALRPLGWFWAGLSFAGALLTFMVITPGIELTTAPRRSNEKIVLLGMIAVGVGLLLDLYPRSRRLLPVFVGVVAAAAITWVLWIKLKRLEGAELWLTVGAAVVYCAWLSAWCETLRQRSMTATVALMVLGFGTGGACLLGATALYGQLGIAIGAAAAGLVMVVVLWGSLHIGSTMTTPAALLVGLLGVGAVVFAKLPWYSLLPLLFIPLIAQLPSKSEWPRGLQVAMMILIMSPFAAAAVWITWQSEGMPPM